MVLLAKLFFNILSFYHFLTTVFYNICLQLSPPDEVQLGCRMTLEEHSKKTSFGSGMINVQRANRKTYQDPVGDHPFKTSAFFRGGGVKNFPNLPTDTSKKLPTVVGSGQKL